MKISVMISAFVLALVLTGCAAASAEPDRASITYGTQTQRGFVNDNGQTWWRTSARKQLAGTKR